MEQPLGYEQDKNYVCKLNKAIYGLKQAPRVWSDKQKITLSKLNYQPTKSDNSLFVKGSADITVYILIYVDDLIVTGNDEAEVSSIIQYLDKKISIKDLGI